MHQQTAAAAALRLTRLHVYPIKSAAGLAPAEWEVDEFGLRHDRRWMVVDSHGMMLSQRTHPRLALVRPSLTRDTLRVEGPGLPPLELPLHPSGGPTALVVVWRDTSEAVWAGAPAAAWFSRLLETDCSLVYMPDTTFRPADPRFAPGNQRVSFADAFAFLMISEESLADLNRRLAVPLPMNRFRPNLVIAGGGVFAEDRLGEFRIGELRLRVVKPCGRCVLTTIDQATTERGTEPLRTLATYRRRGGEVQFGQNVVHQGAGRLRVGDTLRV